MAKSGNTWCKKLMAKDKRNKMRAALGRETRFGLRAGVEGVSKPKYDDERQSLPKKAGWSPKGFGKRKAGRAVMSAEKRDAYVQAWGARRKLAAELAAG